MTYFHTKFAFIFFCPFFLPNISSFPASVCFAHSPVSSDYCFSKIVVRSFFSRKVGPIPLSPPYLKQDLIVTVLLDIAIMTVGNIISTNHVTVVFLFTRGRNAALLLQSMLPIGQLLWMG